MAKRKEERRLSFDSWGLLMALKKVAKERGVSINQMCEESGVNSSTISYMSSAKKQVPDGRNLAALVKWSGVDIGRFSIDREKAPLPKDVLDKVNGIHSKRKLTRSIK